MAGVDAVDLLEAGLEAAGQIPAECPAVLEPAGGDRQLSFQAVLQGARSRRHLVRFGFRRLGLAFGQPLP